MILLKSLSLPAKLHYLTSKETLELLILPLLPTSSQISEGLRTFSIL